MTSHEGTTPALSLIYFPDTDVGRIETETVQNQARPLSKVRGEVLLDILIVLLVALIVEACSCAIGNRGPACEATWRAGRYVLGAHVATKISTGNGYTFGDLGSFYYPGVAEIKGAEPIDVGEGKAVANLKFTIMP